MPNATNARDDAGNTATSLQIVNRADQADSELSSMSLYASYKPRLVFWLIFRGFTPVLLRDFLATLRFKSTLEAIATLSWCGGGRGGSHRKC